MACAPSQLREGGGDLPDGVIWGEGGLPNRIEGPDPGGGDPSVLDANYTPN